MMGNGSGKKSYRKDSAEDYHSDCSTQIGDNEHPSNISQGGILSHD